MFLSPGRNKNKKGKIEKPLSMRTTLITCWNMERS